MSWATLPTMADTSPPSAQSLRLSREGVVDYVTRVWPRAGRSYADGLTELRPGYCRFERVATELDERPGGTMRGPLLMEAVDQAAYALVLGHLGDAALAVTSHLSVEFLRRPAIGTLIVLAHLRKLGRTQITMTCDLHVDTPDPDRPVAIATVAYSQALLG